MWIRRSPEYGENPSSKYAEWRDKKAVMKLEPEVLGRVLKDAIDQIDNGSVESVDTLVRKVLKN